MSTRSRDSLEGITSSLADDPVASAISLSGRPDFEHFTDRRHEHLLQRLHDESARSEFDTSPFFDESIDGPERVEKDGGGSRGSLSGGGGCVEMRKAGEKWIEQELGEVGELLWEFYTRDMNKKSQLGPCDLVQSALCRVCTTYRTIWLLEEMEETFASFGLACLWNKRLVSPLVLELTTGNDGGELTLRPGERVVGGKALQGEEEFRRLEEIRQGLLVTNVCLV